MVLLSNTPVNLLQSYTERITNPRTYWINNGKSSLTSLIACFILGKVYSRTYWRWYACGLKENIPDHESLDYTPPMPVKP